MTEIGCISIQGVPLSQWSDKELTVWINNHIKEIGKYRIRYSTLNTWIGILRVFDECDAPMTVRQVFYQLETRRFVPKTENGYKQTAKNLLKMRKSGIIPYHFITDNTRWIRRPQTYRDLADFLAISKETYRRSVWAFQPVYVEIWIEKEALIGVINETTRIFDVPLVPCKGYPSETLLYEAADDIKRQNKPAYIYYFGDFDPTGKDIPRHIEKTLRGFGAEFSFEVMAVTDEQIQTYHLPTRPTKKKDTRAKKWQGDSVELDALPPRILRDMVKSCIERHIDSKNLEITKKSEDLERETLEQIMSQLGTSPQFGDVTG